MICEESTNGASSTSAGRLVLRALVGAFAIGVVLAIASALHASPAAAATLPSLPVPGTARPPVPAQPPAPAQAPATTEPAAPTTLSTALAPLVSALPAPAQAPVQQAVDAAGSLGQSIPATVVGAVTPTSPTAVPAAPSASTPPLPTGTGLSTGALPPSPPPTPVVVGPDHPVRPVAHHGYGTALVLHPSTPGGAPVAPAVPQPSGPPSGFQTPAGVGTPPTAPSPIVGNQAIIATPIRDGWHRALGAVQPVAPFHLACAPVERPG